MEGIDSPWSDFLYTISRGFNYPLQAKPGFQVCVVCAIPPFPYTAPQAFKKYSEGNKIKITRLPGESEIPDGFYLCDVYKCNEGCLHACGEAGYPLVVAGSGNSVTEARKIAYGRLSRVKIPHMFYRDDIGKRWLDESDLLQTWGYLRPKQRARKPLVSRLFPP